MSPLRRVFGPRWFSEAWRFLRSLVGWLLHEWVVSLPLLGIGAAWFAAHACHRWGDMTTRESVVMAAVFLQVGGLVIGASGLAMLQKQVFNRSLWTRVAEAWKRRPHWPQNVVLVAGTGELHLAGSASALLVGSKADASWQEAVKRLDAELAKVRKEMRQDRKKAEEAVTKLERAIQQERDERIREDQAISATVAKAFDSTGAYLEITALIWLLVSVLAVAFPDRFTGLL